MPSIKKNFFWSTLLTVAGYLFPLVTFPYVTRVLGVEGLGQYQFAYSTVEYFSIIAMLGMGTVGIREIAKVKGNRREMSKVFSSLICLNLLTTLVAILALFVLTLVIPSFIAHNKMLYIGLARILCGTLLIEWFFKGLEDFRFITIRAIAVRFIFVLAVFVFVRDENDYIIYFLLTSLTVAVNAVINILYSRKYVDFSFKGISIRSFTKPVIILGIYQILTAMYTSFNVIYLGAQCGDIEVGYYSTATKLYILIMSVFTSFTGVMLPRMSSYVANGKDVEFKTMTSKSLDFLLLFTMPLIVISEVFAPQIIRLIAGAGYEGAIIPMRMVMPLMLIIGYEQIIIIQMLMPLSKDNAILTNSIVGAIVGIILNLTLVHIFASKGSAIVWIGSELAVMISAQCFVTKYTGYIFPYKKIISSVICYMPLFLFCFFLSKTSTNWIVAMIVGIVVVALCSFFIELYILKNELLRGNFHMIKSRFFEKNQFKR